MSDAVLLQYLHGELDENRRGDVEAELSAAPALSRRLDVLRRRSDHLSQLLRTLDPAPAEIAASDGAIRRVLKSDARLTRPVLTHARWWRGRPALQAAAAIALLLGAVLLVEPARAWVIERARALVEKTGLVEHARPDDASVAPVDETAVPAAAPARFTVPWTGRTFEIDAGSAVGTVVVVRGPEGSVSAEVAGDDAVSVTFVPRGLRVAGPGTTGTIYMVTLPPSVHSLRVSRSGSTTTHDVTGPNELRLPLR